MSTTTEILFNSPALHSLKRDQLVKLCKIHSIKANGKNVDLVERLKTHAKNLPKDSPLSVAFRSEPEGIPENQDDEDGESVQEEKVAMPRPSSQWELVMDSIMEEAEDSSSQGTLSSLKYASTLTGEFGTGSNSSKSTSTVSSSIKALASSFGLKRHATGSSTSTRGPNFTASSKASSNLLSSFPLPPRTDSSAGPADELLKNSTPYHALPLPSLEDLQTDHFTFDTTDPAVVAANLNPTLGTAPLPGHTLRPGVPAPVNARLSLGLAPRTPSKQGPTTTIRLVSFGSTASAAAPVATMPPPGDTPNLKPFMTSFDLDLGSPSAPPAFPMSLYPALPASPPIDDAARRMSLEASMEADEEEEDAPMPGAFGFGAPSPSTPRTVQPFVFGSPSPQSAPFSFAVTSPDAATKAKLAAEVLEEMNRRVFGEAGAPSTPTAPPREIRPLGSAKKGSAGGGRFDKAHEQEFARMESIADVAAKRQGLKRKSSTASVRVSADDQGRGKRVRVDEKGEGEVEKKKQDRTQQEKEAVRRKLDASRARRRSSAAAGGARRASGRVSGARVLVKPKPTRGRFGFFAGAAKLVQGVWGKKTPAPAPLAPKPASTSSTIPKPVPSISKPPTGPNRMAPPPVPSVASTNSKGLRAPSMRSTTSTRSTATGRVRSPLPSFGPPPSGTASSKATAASSARTRNSSIAGASSVGTRTSTASGSMSTRASSLRIGSMGTRGSASSAHTPSSTVDSTRSRPSSRLLAPTASSLAKMNVSPSPSALAAVSEKQDSGSTSTSGSVLGAITNAAGTAAADGPAKGKGKERLLPVPGRKPRISRSRVIAKLASQRVASGSSIASNASAGSSRKSLGGGRVRSSLGAKVQRGSLGGIKNTHGLGGPLDAKKRARQSEYYARRKSQAAEPDDMQVDP